MKIKFLGASGTVTGSSYVLISDSGSAIMVDLGMFQGTKAVDDLNYQTLDYDCSNLSGVILTHAHLDHCGRLPLCLKGGYKGSIHMTPATRDLTELSLLDTAKIARQDHKIPLYDKDFAERTIDKFVTHEYKEQFQIEKFSITFHDAGHILGSAIVEIYDSESNQKIIFSGDLGNSPQPLILPTETMSDADSVIIESTYGDREHEKGDIVEIIKSEIDMIQKTGGTLLIPSFSLERTQELLHIFYHLGLDGYISSDMPIYLDSPLANRATKVFEKYFNLFNSELQTDFKNENPFYFSNVHVTETREESEFIVIQPGPKIILAGSGMMTGGRVVSHAANLLTDPKNRLLIVGYQGEETLGREISEGAEIVKIDDRDVKISAHVTHTRSMSSHADQPKLLSWLKKISGVKQVFITHGEDLQRTELSHKIKNDLGIENIHLPHLNEEISW